MTLQETRQLGIEFERRIQTIIPQKEYINKLDTDTIYSFLNQYLDLYINQIYSTINVEMPSANTYSHIEHILQPLLTITTLGDDSRSVRSITDVGRSLTYKLPHYFGMYVRSNSKVSSVFRFKNAPNDDYVQIVPNKIVSQTQLYDFIQTPFDKMKIMRNPIVVLNSTVTNRNWTFGEEFPITLYREISIEESEDVPQRTYDSITVIYDEFTNIKQLVLVYYRRPKYFNIMDSTPCELPMDAFDDLVTGAVNLYVQYIAATEQSKSKQNEKQLENLGNERN